MADKQYIVETKFTADTEEFKEGVKEVEQGIDKMNDALNQTGESEGAIDEVAEAISQLAKQLEDAAGDSKELAAASRKIGDAAAKAAIGDYKGALSSLKYGMVEIVKVMPKITNNVSSINPLVKAGLSTLAGYAATIAGIFVSLAPAVIYAGKAIRNWVKSIGEARRTMIEMRRRVDDANDAINESGAAAAGSITKFKLLAQQWEQLTPEDKVTEFENYQTALKKLGIAVNNINDADRVFINQSDKVISALVARARAAGAEKLIADAESERLLEEVKKEKAQERLKEVEELEKALGHINVRLAVSSTDLGTNKSPFAEEIDRLRQSIADADKEIAKHDEFISRIDDKYLEAAKKAKTLGEFASGAAEDGSIDALTIQLKKLETQFNATGDATKRAELDEQIKNLKKQIAEMKGETDKGGSPLKAITEDTPPAVGSLDELNEALKKARENYDSAATDEARQYYAAEIAGIEQTIDALNREAEAYVKIQKMKSLGLDLPFMIGTLADHDTMIGAYDPNINLDPSTSPIAKRLKEQQQTVYEATLALQEHVDSYNETLSSMFGDGIVASVSDGVQALSDAVMGIGDIDASGVVAAFLQPFAQMAVSMGETLIASGIGAISLKKLLTNPWTAIAAGTALVALGSIASSAIQKHLNTATGGGGSAGSPNDWVGGGPLLATNSTPIQVEVYGTLSGQDIVLAGNNYTNNQRR